jgi:hypothetical protein
VAALWIPGIARVFFIAQALFWSLSYVARPLVLLAVRPDPHYGDNISDPRLAGLGYDRGIGLVLDHVVFGLWCYALLVLGYALWRRRHPPRPVPAAVADPDVMPTLSVLYALGLLGRAASVATGSLGAAGEVSSGNPLLSFVGTFAGIAALGMIVFLRPARPQTTALVLGALLAGELYWSSAVQSKTPILAAALALAVRFSMLGWNRRTTIGVALIGVLGVAGFGWLQSFKNSGTAALDATVVDSRYPENVRPFLSILRRFDLLEAATDAYFVGPGGWLSPGEVLHHASLSLIPAQVLGAEKLQSGTAWATDVRGASVDMSTVSVSLAEGNVNEGYLLGGEAGVFVAVVFTFVLLLAWERSLYSRFFPVLVLGLAVTGASTLFERGILGSFENLGKFAQSAVFAWLLHLVVTEFRRRPTPLPSPAHASAITKT